MGAGLAGSTTRLYGNANVNQIQYGDKLQGLPPVTGVRRPYKIYRSKAGGNAPGRFRVFCINQLGSVGNVKNSQFAPNADGVGWCPNPKNSREGDAGIHEVDRGSGAIRAQSRVDEKASPSPFCAFTPAEVQGTNERLDVLRSALEKSDPDGVLVAMGDKETVFGDAGLDHGETYVFEDPAHAKDITYVNNLISRRCLWVNRTINGNGVPLGDHILKVVPRSTLEPLYERHYGVLEGSGEEVVHLQFFAFLRRRPHSQPHKPRYPTVCSTTGPRHALECRECVRYEGHDGCQKWVPVAAGAGEEV